MLAVLVLIWAWLRPSPSEFLPEVAPEVGSLLGRAWPAVRTMMTGLLGYLTNQAQNASIDSLQAQLNAVNATMQAFIQAELNTQDREGSAMVVAAHHMHDVGGAVETLGLNQQRLWTRLRYTIMPNTILNIYTVVFRNYIRPLRRGLIATMDWASIWLFRTKQNVTANRAFTGEVQATGRKWRARYVYPQLTFLLSPWRVAFYYQQQITVAVARHIMRQENSQARDTISRVVWNNMDNLWQSFDASLAAWLQTDVAKYGWGADVPKFPKSAEQAPPKMPPGNLEPAVRSPQEFWPSAPIPKIPSADYNLVK